MSELIPIEDIESQTGAAHPDESMVPQVLADDPDLGDGSASHEGFDIASWRLHTLRKDQLLGMAEPEGNDRRSRKARRARQASRDARTEQNRKERKRRRIRVAAVIVTILVAITSVAATYALELWGGRTVPNVEGLPQGRAVELIEAKGFSVSLDTVPSDLLEGRVVSFSPSAGTRLDEGEVVSLVIGSSRIMPEVVGLSEEEALSALEDAGATNVRVQTVVILDEEEGFVREVHPAAGSVFMSTEEITLYVSQLPRVPEVDGLTEKEALKALEEANLPAKVVRERGTVDERLKVIRCEPPSGARVEGTPEVTVFVGDALINPVRLEDYYDATMPDVRAFLTDEGYELKASAKAEDGQVRARFEKANEARIALMREPWTHEADKLEGTADVLTNGARIEGVRLEVEVNRANGGGNQNESGDSDQESEQQEVPAGLARLGLDYAYIDESTAQVIAEQCGFGEPLGSCTDQTIALPPDVERGGHTIYCCYGETGTHVWTILLAASVDDAFEAERIVVTCAPRSFFVGTDSSSGDSKICDFVAYVDEYAA